MRHLRISLALATALGSLAALPAHAALVTTTNVSFDNSASVTDAEGGGATTNNNASLGTSSIQQFNANLGVLMGATLNLSNSTQIQTTYVTSTDGPNTDSNGQVTSNGTGSSSVAIGATGVSHTFATISQADSCINNRQRACTGTASTNSSATNWAGNVASGSLSSYVGIGDVSITRTATTLSASQTNGVFTGVESTQSTVRWTGDQSATYDYLLHASPSFGASALILDLDFGTVFLGDTAPFLSFSIFNAAGDRVGLDLDSISGSGNLSQLYANFFGFSALGAGSSSGYFASFNTLTAGDFLTMYTLGLSDADVGAANSRFNYSMTLNLKGSVVERPANSVPEPGTLALLGLGLVGLGLNRRRKAN